MTLSFSPLKISRFVCACVAGGLFLGFVPGCDKEHDKEEPAATASDSSTIEAASRTVESKPGRGEYETGQSLLGQSQYDEAKKHFDKAISDSKDNQTKGLAMLGRANCNLGLKNFHLASRQYHWLDTMYRDVKGIPQDEVLFKMGMSVKGAGNSDMANYWFRQVLELYATGPFAEEARRESTRYTPKDAEQKPLVYTLEVESYGSREKAESEASILREKGYRDVQIVETSEFNHKQFQVHVGKFGNKNDAAHAQTDAELAGLPTTIFPRLVNAPK